SIFEKVDAVRKERHRANGQGHSKLDAKVAEVQDGRESDDAAHPSCNSVRCGRFHSRLSSPFSDGLHAPGIQLDSLEPPRVTSPVVRVYTMGRRQGSAKVGGASLSHGQLYRAPSVKNAKRRVCPMTRRGFHILLAFILL